jgi:hypothetical protein
MSDNEDSMEVWLEDLDESDDESYYETIREILSPEYRNLYPEDIDTLLEDVFEGVSPGEIESFWDTLKGLGRAAKGIAAKAIPVAAPVIGTAFGGPLGGAIGSTVGKLAGQALGGTPQSPKATAQAQIPGGGSSATAQLMSFLQNPAFLQSMLGQVLGKAGHSSVPVGQQGASADFGAFMTALSTLTNQAAAEANAREDSQGTPRYLLDKKGDFRCDPAVPEERARVLIEQLSDGYPAEADDEGEDDLTEWFLESGLMERRPRSRRYRRRLYQRYPGRGRRYQRYY